MRGLRKLYDVDGVLADLVGGLCARTNAVGFVTSKTVLPEQVTTYDFEDCLHSVVVDHWRDVMLEEGFALSLPVYPQAREQVQTFLDSGYEIVYVTKPYRPSRTWAYDRLEWLDKYMPKAPVVMTGHKHLIKGDILVEDHPGNLSEWLDHHPTGMGVLVDRPWNQSVGKLEQYPNWCRRVS